MERTSPNYNDPNFQKRPEDSTLDKYERGFDKALNAANTIHSVGRKIGYIFMGLFFFLIGGGLLIWGIFNYTDRVKELDTYVKTTGTVVELREVPQRITPVLPTSPSTSLKMPPAKNSGMNQTIPATRPNLRSVRNLKYFMIRTIRTKRLKIHF